MRYILLITSITKSLFISVHLSSTTEYLIDRAVDLVEFEEAKYVLQDLMEHSASKFESLVARVDKLVAHVAFLLMWP